MKYLKIAALFILSFILSSSSCKKEVVVSPLSSLDKTAPATQTGADTFGSLVDGGVFTSSNQIFKPHNLYSSYQPSFGGFLSVDGTRDIAPFTTADISIQTDSLAISAGQTIPLTKKAPGMAYADFEVHDYGAGTDDLYNIAPGAPGQLHITRFDPANHIISGTFSFDAVNAQGGVVHVTDGRFDVYLR